MVRALAAHQCGPGSNPGVDTICGSSLLLVLSLAPRGFSPGTPVFPSPQKPTLSNSNSIWNSRTQFSNNTNNYNLQLTNYNFFFSVFRRRPSWCPKPILCDFLSVNAFVGSNKFACIAAEQVSENAVFYSTH